MVISALLKLHRKCLNVPTYWLTEWCLAANPECFGNHALEGEFFVWIGVLAGLKKTKKTNKACFKLKKIQNKKLPSLCVCSACIIHSHWMFLHPTLFCAWCFSTSVDRPLIRLTQLVFSDGAKTIFIRLLFLSRRSHGGLHSGWGQHSARRLHPGSSAVRAARRSLRLCHTVSSATARLHTKARITSLISGTESEELSFVNSFEMVSEPCFQLSPPRKLKDVFPLVMNLLRLL